MRTATVAPAISTRPLTQPSLPTGLGDTTATVNATGVAGGVNSTTLHLRGQKVLAAQLATLAKLGMAGATEILVTGMCKPRFLQRCFCRLC